MTRRGLAFALTRPKVVVLGLLGTAMVFWGGPSFLAAIVLAVAAWNIAKTLGHDDLDDRLRLRSDKLRHRIRRQLRHSEREAILNIDAYVKRLCDSGADAELGRQTLEHAWKLVAEAGPRDATAALEAFTQSLPPLVAPPTTEARTPTEESVARKIERELAILRASQLEIESVG